MTMTLQLLNLKLPKIDKVLDEEFKNSLIKGRNGEQNKEINSQPWREGLQHRQETAQKMNISEKKMRFWGK